MAGFMGVLIVICASFTDGLKLGVVGACATIADIVSYPFVDNGFKWRASQVLCLGLTGIIQRDFLNKLFFYF